MWILRLVKPDLIDVLFHRLFPDLFQRAEELKKKENQAKKCIFILKKGLFKKNKKNNRFLFNDEDYGFVSYCNILVVSIL